MLSFHFHDEYKVSDPELVNLIYFFIFTLNKKTTSYPIVSYLSHMIILLLHVSHKIYLIIICFLVD